MNILITGITGFLGRHLAAALKEEHAVSGLSRHPEEANVPEGINTFKPEDIESLNFLPEVVIMCHAAVASGNIQLNNDILYQGNVQFTEWLVQKFPSAYHLYISSVAVYGNDGTTLTEKSITAPSTAYGLSKLWGERTVLNAAPAGILRLSSLYGNGMKENTIIPVYALQAITQNKIEVWGTGERKQNYFFVEDAIAYIKSMIVKKAAGIFLGVSSTEKTNLELAKVLSTLTNADINFVNTDNVISFSFDNSATKAALDIRTESDWYKNLNDYITWRKERF